MTRSRVTAIAATVFSIGLAALAGAACHSSPHASGSPPPAGPSTKEVRGAIGAQAPPPRDDGRLPTTATPLRYAVQLTIDPRETRFAGSESILVDVPQPTAFVVLHARDLEVQSAKVTQGARTLTASASHRAGVGAARDEELVLALPEPLEKGRATIAITFDAPFAADLAGVYRVKADDRWYAFTQFEATDARRAFPCFDEPSFKTPYDLSITAPKGMIAVANSPDRAHADAGAMTTFDFATTRPLPSYLVAFAVGDFDVKAYAGSSPIPLRLVAPKGRIDRADLALETAAALVKRLGDYFDVKYPYEKLDLVAVPDFSAGAMENAGLITFMQDVLLIDAKNASVEERRELALVIAHELAHQWFGNLVTMQWWDDLWLNEGFATWMESKVVDEYKPELRARIDEVRSALRVMDIDGLRAARAVRGAVRTPEDATEIFDGITYAKAGALLRMLEQWLGEATFQKGVRDYIRAYAWKNARADDLLRALDLASNKDVTKTAASFLDRAGVPSMKVALRCKGTRATAQVKQSPWRPLGEPDAQTSAASSASDAGAPRWIVPLCMRAGGVADPVCLLSSGEPTETDLAKCPTWLYPNAHQAGYFRFALEAPQMNALAKNARALEPAERVGLVSDAWAEVRSGDLEPAMLLDMLPAFDADDDMYVTSSVTSALASMDEALVDDGVRAPFRGYAAARVGRRARALGWEKKKGEKDDDAIARARVLRVLGAVVDDEATLREADAIAKRWLHDPSSVGADIAPLAVELGSRRAGVERFDALLAAAKSAKTPETRRIALSALGAFGDAELLKRALDRVLDPDLRVHEAAAIALTAAGYPASRATVWAWTKAHWDALRARMPSSYLPYVLLAGAEACTRDALDEVKRFVEPRASGIEGMKRPAREAMESAELCVALREQKGAAFAQYFGGANPTKAGAPR